MAKEIELLELGEKSTEPQDTLERVRRESLEQVRRECDAKIERERRLSEISLDNKRDSSRPYLTFDKGPLVQTKNAQERVRKESLEQVRLECDAKIERERRLSEISLKKRRDSRISSLTIDNGPFIQENVQERVRRESLEQVRRECDAKIEQERRQSEISLENKRDSRRSSLISLTKRRLSVQLPTHSETDADTWTNRARGIVRRYFGKSAINEQ